MRKSVKVLIEKAEAVCRCWEKVPPVDPVMSPLAEEAKMSRFVKELEIAIKKVKGEQ